MTIRDDLSEDAMKPKPYVLFDVDGCLLDYRGNIIPGIQRLLDTLRLLGFEIRIWSAGGKEYARETAERLGLAGVAECYRKPSYPPTLEDALALLGSAPALQVDDDPTERIPGWPFMDTPCDHP